MQYDMTEHHGGRADEHSRSVQDWSTLLPLALIVLLLFLSPLVYDLMESLL